MKKINLCMALFACIISNNAFAAEIVTVTPTNSPSGEAQSPAPFTYSGTTGSRTQQVYASSFFGTSESISAIAFRSTPGFRNGATYSNVNISLSTTGFGDESGTPLSNAFADNIGSDVINVFNGALSFAAPTTDGFDYIINLTHAFTYDPTKGNLLLDVTIPFGSLVSGPGFFLASYDTANRATDGVYSVNSVFDGNATSGIANTAGTITQFTGSTLAAAVPEPATWAMMLAGFGMIGFAARRRPSVKTTVRFA